MHKIISIRFLLIFSLLIFIVLGNIGGCNNHNGREGDDDSDSLRTCDLSGKDSACQVCADQNQQACCTLTTPPGCGNLNMDGTQCHTDLSGACKIVKTPPPPPGSKRTITIVNNCSEPVWIGGKSIKDTALLCEPNSSNVIMAAIGDCGPEGGQSGKNNQGTTIPDNPAWTGPPPWGNNGTATWEIPTKDNDPSGLQGIRQLTIPNCWDSGILFARTGYTSTGPGELTCKTANCGPASGVEDCGGTNGPKPSSLAEFTFNGGIPGSCVGEDNYDVSFVAGFTQLIEVEPETNQNCGSAGKGCSKLPTCPYDTFVFEPAAPGNIGGFVKSEGSEIAVCFSPFNMASIKLPPFDKFTKDEADRLGCVGNYVETPWANGFIWGVCMLNFGNNAKSCALSEPGMCENNTNVPPLGNSTPPCCSEPMTMCDPYGQCDEALKRTAVWPEFNDNGTMTPSTKYIENVHEACGDNKAGGQAGTYAWSYDDGDQVLGLANALFRCNDQSANYTITLCGDGE